MGKKKIKIKKPKPSWKDLVDVNHPSYNKDYMKGFSGGGHVNTRRENRLEELGRVDAEKAYTKKGKRNLRAEKKRIVREVSSRGAAKRGHGKEIK